MNQPADAIAVKLGLQRRDRRRKVIPLRLTGAPAHPASVDHLAGVLAWNGRTNFTFGTCGPVTCANSAIMTWKYLLGLDITVSDNAVFDLYRRSGNPNFDPATGADDNGVEMTVMLSALLSGGIEITHSDGGTEIIKPVCFAELAPEDLDGVQAATSIMGGLALAWDLDVAQQQQTIWDYVPGSAPWGGHATFGGAYTGLPSSDETVVSWTKKYGTSDTFVARQMNGAYGLLWRPLWDHPAFQQNVDQAALADYYQQLTGRIIPAPVPVPPAPVPPVPVPDPVDADTAYAHDPAVIRWAKRKPGTYAKDQYRAWKQAKGL